MTLQYHGGELIIDSIRGKSTQGISNYHDQIVTFAGLGKHGKLVVQKEDWGLFIPSVSTMRHYLPYVKTYEELTLEKGPSIIDFVLLKQILVNKLKVRLGHQATPVVGWCGDEMEVRAGLTYLEAMGIIVGCADGLIAEKNIQTLDKTTILPRLATKIMMIHIVSTDGKTALPVIQYPTVKMSAEWLATKVERCECNFYTKIVVRSHT